ncbi:hypothetical protein [Geodermatophilus obscurus]|uniref:hypothetical protein n=1 Tax=Geodermatophilus obscurus TaxID=1861 RepID=UPI00019B7371|nr:hypothetical protein [Geodermatophilus obscurus]
MDESIPLVERHGAAHVVRPVLGRRRIVANTQAAPPSRPGSSTAVLLDSSMPVSCWMP